MWPSTRSPSAPQIERWGLKSMQEVFRFDYENMQALEALIAKHKIDCDYVTTGGLLLARWKEEMDEFRQTIAAIKELKLEGESIDLVSREACPKYTLGGPHEGALLQRKAGQFWPAKFVLALAKIVQDAGVCIYTDTEVESVGRETEGEQFLVKTKRGEIRCNKVVYATNGYAAGLCPELKGIIKPVRGQVIMTSPLRARFPCSFGINDGYEYMIQRPDGCVVFGGLRWRAGNKQKEEGVYDDGALNPEIAAGLPEVLREYFPVLVKEQFSVQAEWTGIMGYTPDSNPLVGPFRSEGEYLIAGFTGHGMPRCFLSGQAIAQMICGSLDPAAWMPPFSPSRFSAPLPAAQ